MNKCLEFEMKSGSDSESDSAVVVADGDGEWALEEDLELDPLKMNFEAEAAASQIRNQKIEVSEGLMEVVEAEDPYLDLDGGAVGYLTRPSIQLKPNNKD